MEDLCVSEKLAEFTTLLNSLQKERDSLVKSMKKSHHDEGYQYRLNCLYSDLVWRIDDATNSIKEFNEALSGS